LNRILWIGKHSRPAWEARAHVFLCREDLPSPQLNSTQVRMQSLQDPRDPRQVLMHAISKICRVQTKFSPHGTAMTTKSRHGRTGEGGMGSVADSFDHTMYFCSETEHLAHEQNGTIHLQVRVGLLRVAIEVVRKFPTCEVRERVRQSGVLRGVRVALDNRLSGLSLSRIHRPQRLWRQAPPLQNLRRVPLQFRFQSTFQSIRDGGRQAV